MLDGQQKYVASTALQEPLSWPNSTLLQGDAADSVVLGSGLRLFDDGVHGPRMELVDAITTTTDVLITAYRSVRVDPS